MDPQRDLTLVMVPELMDCRLKHKGIRETQIMLTIARGQLMITKARLIFIAGPAAQTLWLPLKDIIRTELHLRRQNHILHRSLITRLLALIGSRTRHLYIPTGAEAIAKLKHIDNAQGIIGSRLFTQPDIGQRLLRRTVRSSPDLITLSGLGVLGQNNHQAMALYTGFPVVNINGLGFDGKRIRASCIDSATICQTTMLISRRKGITVMIGS